MKSESAKFIFNTRNIIRQLYNVARRSNYAHDNYELEQLVLFYLTAHKELHLEKNESVEQILRRLKSKNNVLLNEIIDKFPPNFIYFNPTLEYNFLFEHFRSFNYNEDFHSIYRAVSNYLRSLGDSKSLNESE